MSLRHLPQAFRPVLEPLFYDWVEKGCSGPLTSLSRYIPPVFESYVHICHPVWQFPANAQQPSYTKATDREKDKQMIPMRWSEAVKERFPAFDGKSSWGEIAPIRDYASPLPGDIDPPHEGVPPIEAVNAVEKAISTVTGPEQECIFAIWHGFDVMCLGQPHLSRTKIMGMSQPAHWVLQAPRSTLFDYWRKILEIPHYWWSANQTPHAVWSTKRQWFYAVPFAEHSSFFAGSETMTKILLESKDIEAYRLPEGHTFKL